MHMTICIYANHIVIISRNPSRTGRAEPDAGGVQRPQRPIRAQCVRERQRTASADRVPLTLTLLLLLLLLLVLLLMIWHDVRRRLANVQASNLRVMRLVVGNRNQRESYAKSI